MEFGQKKLKLIYLISRIFLVWTFLNFLVHCENVSCLFTIIKYFQDEHCEINVDQYDWTVTLVPYAGARTCINGEEVSDPTLLRNGDRIFWGSNHFFRINCPKVFVYNLSHFCLHFYISCLFTYRLQIIHRIL